MNSLDFPLEALSLLPVTLGVINNLWAWLAVFAAAVSFWRLCATVATTTGKPPAPPNTPPCSPICISPPAKTTTSYSAHQEKEEEKEEEEVFLSRGNSKKFFRVYYEEIKREDGEEDDVDGEDESELGPTGWTAEMRGRGVDFDLGWYSYQDRGVLDGSVVRLWEEVTEGNNTLSPRSYRCKRRFSVGVTASILS